MMNLKEFLIKFKKLEYSEDKADIIELISGYSGEGMQDDISEYSQEEMSRYSQEEMSGYSQEEVLEETLEAIIEIVENKPLKVKKLLIPNRNC